ncbi:hypothetical protein TD95_001456 [Thielaviopsis punctulata]|uniref:L-2-hydroxyglutarate dehydrogenase, mitochondrial n=1 Tax=Thielaviopsis punctulata TaxID=72032 RepID=A0A0F4ZAL6_9PEZI|nr:hypothetical protein TD95_001456 [Thielaviopsis punctulata]
MILRRTPTVIRLGSRAFSASTASRADFAHIVIGGGVIGLSIAQRLSQRTSSVLLLERHTALGTETSSRNSEVLHAGIYYGLDSAKAALCIRGRHLAYAFCAAHGVAHQKLGKWIVAQTAAQRAALDHVADTAHRLAVPVRWVGAREAQTTEPAVQACAGVLESPETGIVDSHGFMQALHGLLDEAGGTVALGAEVVAVRGEGMPRGSQGWSVEVRDKASGETSWVTGDSLINAAGLGAVAVNNMIAPERQREMFYAKGNYFSYSGSVPRTSRLIYPAPTPGGGGLGTHLTLDMAGRLRFGPDVEWVSSPDDLAVNSARLSEAVCEIKKYLPGIDETLLVPDYAGIRPKLAPSGAVGAGKGFQDFIITKEDGYSGWINLLGIESPGLTSSLAIAERVEQLLYK